MRLSFTVPHFDQCVVGDFDAAINMQVNTSGQFVGLAEMVGPVDFHKNVEYWQQDKWMGCFPVKWHIVKDVPNNLLKHITLENNENKPVTNSRDTQEVFALAFSSSFYLFVLMANIIRVLLLLGQVTTWS